MSTYSAFSIPCPVCRAVVGAACTGPAFVHRARWEMHRSRRMAARESRWAVTARARAIRNARPVRSDLSPVEVAS